MLTKEFTRITEDLRENGTYSLFYCEYDAGADIYYLPNNEDISHIKHIYEYDINEIDSYPIIFKFVSSIDETIFTIGVSAEGTSVISNANTDKYHFQENLLLCPYI
ncbi:hypothetical protein BDB01DRAFT_835044 [Pilobolus umbonatus]|nr:hypothetical protein BDB01DRAFT_835044 [Pilobolus umbonatus]